MAQIDERAFPSNIHSTQFQNTSCWQNATKSTGLSSNDSITLFNSYFSMPCQYVAIVYKLSTPILGQMDA